MDVARFVVALEPNKEIAALAFASHESEKSPDR
jgi:hypothetical protein